MKAAQISSYGAPEVLSYDDVAPPEVGPGQVRIKVQASGVNFAETHARGGDYAAMMTLPAVLGGEAAGVVETVGSSVTGLAVGDRVAAPLFATWATGGYAELVATDAAGVVKLPDSVSNIDATALMAQGYTALQLSRLFPAKGKRVLVHAAAGGVGSLLLQLLKAQGASGIVAAASHDEKLALTTGLGADATVNYSRADWVEAAKSASGGVGFDIIYDAAGGEITRASLGLLAPLGHLVVFGGTSLTEFSFGGAEMGLMSSQNLSVSGFSIMPLLATNPIGEAMAELFALVEAGKLKVPPAQSYRLSEAARAHADLEGRKTTGKVVLIP